MFRGNPESTGVTAHPLPDQLEVLWRFAVPGGGFDSTPAIAGDRVFVGDLDGRLYALDLKTGQRVWEFKSEIGFIAAPAVQGDRVFVGDIDGVFFCLKADTGEVLWKFTAQAEIDSSANFFGEQVLVGSQDARPLLPEHERRFAGLEARDRRSDPLHSHRQRRFRHGGRLRFAAACH